MFCGILKTVEVVHRYSLNDKSVMNLEGKGIVKSSGISNFLPSVFRKKTNLSY